MSLSSDFCRQSRAISSTWWCTKRTMATESAAMSEAAEESVSLLRMKFCSRSSICFVAFGKRSFKELRVLGIDGYKATNSNSPCRAWR